MTKTKSIYVLEWLQIHDIFNHSQLELKANIPGGTLSKCILGVRKLPKTHEQSLKKLLKTYGYK